MSADEILRALISRGYFPKELPPTFTTVSFGQHARDIIARWERADLFKKQPKKLNRRKTRRGSYGYEIPKAEMENISVPKLGFERRTVGITHPLPQSLLAGEIADNYGSVQKWLARQTYSLDEIRVSERNARAIRGINFSLHRAKKSYIEATSDWLVKTDITRFYPSIYTHSLTWAAYGKEIVKANLKRFEGSLADRLDMLVRACNRNQTIGIPVGPETSRILAEVVSSRIDDDLSRGFRDIQVDMVDRLQDDWFIGVKTLERAENVLSQISSAYAEYSLDINGRKTSVTRIIQHLEEGWKSELAGFLSHRAGDLKGARLREFLGLALRLQTEFEKQAVTNYTLTVLEGQTFEKVDVEALESFLLKAAITSPGSMSRISELILNLDYDTKAVSKQRIGTRFSELAVRSLKNGHTYEALWCLYTLRGLSFPITDREFVHLILGTRSSALGLTLLDMKARGLVKTAFPTQRWEAQIDPDSVHSDWTWLLAYEAMRRGWLPDPYGLMGKPFFAEMNSRGVVFYDERRNVRRRREMLKIRKAIQKRARSEVRSFLLSVRSLDPFVDDSY